MHHLKFRKTITFKTKVIKNDSIFADLKTFTKFKTCKRNLGLPINMVHNALNTQYL